MRPLHAAPRTAPVRTRPGRFERLLAGFVAVVGCSVFAIAAALDPYDATGVPRTRGTHLQLGLPACTLLSIVGFPCPSCGMTTAVSLFVHGDPAASWRTNCAGTLIAGAGAIATAWLALLAWGMARQPWFTAERVILLLSTAGASVTIARYLGLVANALVGNPP